MEKREYIIILYDYYMKLLTDKERQAFEDYYFNNYTLSEIASNQNISRSAIHKKLKSIEIKLNKYEDKLELYENSQKIDLLLEKITDKTLKEKIKELY